MTHSLCACWMRWLQHHRARCFLCKTTIDIWVCLNIGYQNKIYGHCLSGKWYMGILKFHGWSEVDHHLMAIAGSPSSLQGPRHGITQVEAQEGAEHVQPQGLLSTQTRRHQDEVGRPQGPRKGSRNKRPKVYGAPKRMGDQEKSHWTEWFGGTPILGNHHVLSSGCTNKWYVIKIKMTSHHGRSRGFRSMDMSLWIWNIIQNGGAIQKVVGWLSGQ